MLSPGQRKPRLSGGRVRGAMTTAEFLRGVLERARAQLPTDLRGLQAQQVGSLIKLHDGEQPAIHFELWVHHNRSRVELGLHFETRSADRNGCLLEFVSEELMFLKAALGNGLEAEPWDKGWTRLYVTRPIERLGAAEQVELAATFAEFIVTLEPLRRDALAACP
jgi:hypothetical protein